MTDPGELLVKYSPTLVYDGEERFFADSVETMLVNTFAEGPSEGYASTLYGGQTRNPIASAKDDDEATAELTLGFLCGGDTYANGEKVSKDDWLDPGPEAVADARRMHPSYGNRIYGHVAEGKDGHWLQYWFFYFASTKGIPGVHVAKGLFGFGLHEGDWEMCQWHVPKGADTPDRATFAAHSHGHKIDWADMDMAVDGSPKVYIGRDSHASYPKKGKWSGGSLFGIGFDPINDYCDGRGAVNRPAVDEIATGKPSWVDWPGHWGGTRKSNDDNASPPGPAFHQQQWTKPDDFDHDAHDWTKGFLGDPDDEAEADLVAPEGIGVTVTGTGQHWRIDLDVPESLEGQWTGALTFMMNSPNIEAPRTEVWPIGPGTE
jgi:hypothetical protein